MWWYGAHVSSGSASHRIALGGCEYPYHVCYDGIDWIASTLGQTDADMFVVVTDDTVQDLYGASLSRALGEHAWVEVLSEPPGEAMKSPSVLSRHLERAIAAGASRRSIVVGFGGGVPGNLAGMVAALLFRGVRLVHIPTTTVAAMDSVLSLKQAINSDLGKNHIGTYWAPEAVFTDLRLLETLPKRELRSGLCEAAKNCLALRPAALPRLRELLDGGDWASAEAQRWLLEESLAAKLAVLAHDGHEQRAGLVLEYGHTVGHALEFCDQRRRDRAAISHGEAVALGLAVAARVSAALEECGPDLVAAHDDVIAALGVPLRLPDGPTTTEVLDVVRLDNKRGYLDLAPDHVAMVLLRELGDTVAPRDCPLVPVPIDVVGEALEELSAAASVELPRALPA